MLEPINAVYALFMLLMLWWGRKVGMSAFPWVPKFIGVIALFLFFNMFEDKWQELWFYMFPHYAFAVGFVLGLFPDGSPGFAFPTLSTGRVKRAQRQAEADVERQRVEAEAEIKRQEREASERVNRQHRKAEEDLARQRKQATEELAEKVRRAKEQAARAERERADNESKAVPDPYEVLGVSRDATKADIKSAYRMLVSELHPDRAHNSTDSIRKLAEEKFKEINRAYESIKD